MSLPPLLYKILSNWRGEPERPPLLLDGLDESGWKPLLEDIIVIFTKEKLKPDHPDIIVLKRDPKKQIIEVKQTRQFIKKLSLSTYDFSFKLGIIPAADQLNVQSQNALLKTLEEPLKKRYLIMGATVSSKLLPTILSRVTIINLKPPAETGYNRSQHSVDLQNEIADLYQDCLNSTLPERLIKGQDWSEGKGEKVSDFFNSVIPILQTKLKESLKQKNAKAARETAGQLKIALNYSEQLGRTGGTNPKILLEAFLLQIPINK